MSARRVPTNSLGEPKAEPAVITSNRNAELDKFGQVFGQCVCPMLFETQIVLDFIGGADADRTRDLLNAICGGAKSAR
jgi:hypothetical protein